MENKNNFAGIIIPVIVAVILLTVLPIINSINGGGPPCEDLPTLYAPTISISDDTLTITPNSSNGDFVNGYKIYVDDVLLDTVTSTTYNLSNELTEVGTYEIYVTAYATLFTDSEPSNIKEYVVEPVPTGPKFFEVGDVLPVTTQLKISWISFETRYRETVFVSTSSDFWLIYEWEDNKFCLNINNSDVYMNKHIYPAGNVIIDTSSWSEAKRTISYVDSLVFTWEDLNA